MFLHLACCGFLKTQTHTLMLTWKYIRPPLTDHFSLQAIMATSVPNNTKRYTRAPVSARAGLTVVSMVEDIHPNTCSLGNPIGDNQVFTWVSKPT